MEMCEQLRDREVGAHLLVGEIGDISCGGLQIMME